MVKSMVIYLFMDSSRRCYFSVNPLSRNGDKNEISLYILTNCSNIQVMRIKKVITKDKMSSYLDKFSLLVPLVIHGEQ